MANSAGTLDYVNDSVIQARQSESIQTALNAATGEISSPISRDILPGVDLDDPNETAWDGELDEFIQTPTADVTAGDSVEVYELDSDNGKMDDRVMAIYGFEAVEGADYVSTILFRGSDGQIFERAQIQGLDETGDTPVDRQSVLQSPILFDTQDNGTIEFVFGEDVAFDTDSGTLDPADVKIKLLGVTVEKRGRRIGNRN